MIDFRPIGYVLGILVGILGITMLIPMGFDMASGSDHWEVFLYSSVICILMGGAMTIATDERHDDGLSIQQMFLLTTVLWVVLPIFASLPFLLGATDASFADAFFESTSGLTTTGATVFSNLQDLPEGLLLWRSMLQWFGGVGIIVVAMVFLPELRIGGMQVFRSEAFDTHGKVLPRAAEISGAISVIYIGITFICMLSYAAVGMSGFEAFNHALTTMSTGGFSTSDASFGVYQGAPEYVATIFMVLASLPFVRYIQLLAGTAKPLWRDSQIHAYLVVIFILTVVLTLFQVFLNASSVEMSFREALFNVTSIISGTGFASTDYQLWGSFPAVCFFFVGLIGGCAGSTACSIKIFRYQMLFLSLKNHIKSIHSPHGVFSLRYQGRSVEDDVISSVMAFFTLFLVTLGVIAVLLSATGLDMVTSISGAATAVANIGPGLGDIIGPSGNFGPLNDTAKWILSAGMLIGRLEVMSVFALFTFRFWQV